jgi:hypothetical protein
MTGDQVHASQPGFTTRHRSLEAERLRQRLRLLPEQLVRPGQVVAPAAAVRLARNLRHQPGLQVQHLSAADAEEFGQDATQVLRTHMDQHLAGVHQIKLVVIEGQPPRWAAQAGCAGRSSPAQSIAGSPRPWCGDWS